MLKVSDLTLLFLMAHLLADFYLQSEKMAQKKDRRFKSLLLHSLVYSLVMMLLSGVLVLMGSSIHLLTAGFAISALHLLIDAAKFALGLKYLQESSQESKLSAKFYITDQLLHIAVILTIIQFFYVRLYGFTLPSFVREDVIRWTLLVLLNAKPANVTFKKLFYPYVPDEPKQEKTNPPDTAPRPPQPGAGALIGSIERFLCLIFISLGQFAAIGLIYTAKSIARFEKIGKDHRFAEYYLIGTLYSILYVLLCYGLIMEFIY